MGADGFGFLIAPADEARSCGHGGVAPVMNALLRVCLESGKSVTVLCQLDSFPASRMGDGLHVPVLLNGCSEHAVPPWRKLAAFKYRLELVASAESGRPSCQRRMTAT